jgi:hypothetical protein
MKIKPIVSSDKIVYFDKTKLFEQYPKDIPDTRLTVTKDRVTIKISKRDENDPILIKQLIEVAHKLQGIEKSMRGAVKYQIVGTLETRNDYIFMYDNEKHFNIKFYFKDLLI